MRKFLIPLLMAGVAIPAAASAEDGRGPRSHGERAAQSDSSSDDQPQRVQHHERSSSDGARVERSSTDSPRVHRDRPDRPEHLERRIQRVEASDQVQQVQATEPVEVRRVERRGGQIGGFQQTTTEPQRGGCEEGCGEHDPQAGQHGNDVVLPNPQDHREGDDVVVGGDRRGDRDGDRDGVRDGHRDGDRDGVRDGHRDGDGRRHRWSTDWRRDHRYDWRSHRHHHRSLFHLGRYYDPYGWGYRRFSIGYTLWPSYYGNRYWLNDPWMYRLPYAPPGYRWIRYYDDALLVDTWTGQVVDVIRNFFW